MERGLVKPLALDEHAAGIDHGVALGHDLTLCFETTIRLGPA
jgi:hypothetical protein